MNTNAKRRGKFQGVKLFFFCCFFFSFPSFSDLHFVYSGYSTTPNLSQFRVLIILTEPMSKMTEEGRLNFVRTGRAPAFNWPRIETFLANYRFCWKTYFNLLQTIFELASSIKKYYYFFITWSSEDHWCTLHWTFAKRQINVTELFQIASKIFHIFNIS